MHMGRHVRLLIDSGAFMDFTSNKPVWTHRAYAMWMREIEREVLPHVAEFAGFFTLDVIGDPVATRANYEALLDAGHRPLPILTRGSTDADAQRYMDIGDRIGIGALVGSSPPEIARRVAQLPMDYPQHWLGTANARLLAQRRPTSIDVSSWVSHARFGELALYAGGGKVDIIRVHQAASLTTVHRAKLRALGFDPLRIYVERGPAGGGAPLIHCVNTATYLQYVQDLRDKLNVSMYLVWSDNPAHSLMLFQRYLGELCTGLQPIATLKRIVHRSSGKPGELNVTPEEVCNHV